MTSTCTSVRSAGNARAGFPCSTRDEESRSAGSTGGSSPVRRPARRTPSVTALLRDEPSDVPVITVAARRADRAGLPLLLILALGQPSRRVSHARGRQDSQTPAAAAAARVHKILQLTGVTVRTSLAILHASVYPVHQRKYAAEVAARTAARLHGDLVSGASVGLEPDHPFLTPAGAALLEQRLERCRTELAALVTGGHGGGALEITTRIWEELRGLEAVLRSSEILTDRGTLPWVELGSHVRVETPDGEESVRIVHPIEAVLDAERISSLSPLAQALLGRRAGDTVEVAAPRGHYPARILAVGAGESTARRRGRALDPVSR